MTCVSCHHPHHGVTLIDTLEIQVEGYASPIAPSDYNRYLTSRRISSVKNHLQRYNGGVLQPYLDNNQILIVEVPNGEEEAAPGVSPDPNDRRKSVYAPRASRERRVRIIDIKRREGKFSLLSNPSTPTNPAGK